MVLYTFAVSVVLGCSLNGLIYITCGSGVEASVIGRTGLEVTTLSGGLFFEGAFNLGDSFLSDAGFDG